MGELVGGINSGREKMGWGDVWEVPASTKFCNVQPAPNSGQEIDHQNFLVLQTEFAFSVTCIKYLKGGAGYSAALKKWPSRGGGGGGLIRCLSILAHFKSWEGHCEQF